MQLSVVEEKEGRPTKLDEAMAAKIADGLSYGLTNQEVADLVSIDVSTLYDWFKLPEFSRRISSAKAQRKLIRIKRVENGDTGWASCAWLLERTDPQLWGRHLIYQRGPEEKNITDKSKFLEDLKVLGYGRESAQ